MHDVISPDYGFSIKDIYSVHDIPTLEKWLSHQIGVLESLESYASTLKEPEDLMKSNYNITIQSKLFKALKDRLDTLYRKYPTPHERAFVAAAKEVLGDSEYLKVLALAEKLKKENAKTPRCNVRGYVRFSTKELAELRLEQIKRHSTESKVPQRVYKCKTCGGWHLSSMSEEDLKKYYKKKKINTQAKRNLEARHWEERLT